MAKAKGHAPPPAAQAFQDRIVGFGRKPADQFQANPDNIRDHPQEQRDAMRAMLATVGWAGVVVENVRTGHLIDGHERVWQALETNGDVPYIQVDVSQEEEGQLLLLFDQISAMARPNAEKLRALVARLGQPAEPALRLALEALAARAGVAAGDLPQRPDFDALIDEFRHDRGGEEKNEHWFYVEFYADGATFKRLLGQVQLRGNSSHELDPAWFARAVEGGDDGKET
jgi:hypothetical protein